MSNQNGLVIYLVKNQNFNDFVGSENNKRVLERPPNFSPRGQIKKNVYFWLRIISKSSKIVHSNVLKALVLFTDKKTLSIQR